MILQKTAFEHYLGKPSSIEHVLETVSIGAQYAMKLPLGEAAHLRVAALNKGVSSAWSAFALHYVVCDVNQLCLGKDVLDNSVSLARSTSSLAQYLNNIKVLDLGKWLDTVRTMGYAASFFASCKWIYENLTPSTESDRIWTAKLVENVLSLASVVMAVAAMVFAASVEVVAALSVAGLVLATALLVTQVSKSFFEIADQAA